MCRYCDQQGKAGTRKSEKNTVITNDMYNVHCQLRVTKSVWQRVGTVVGKKKLQVKRHNFKIKR